LRARTPRAIWLLIAILALTQPLVHVLCLDFPPSGTVVTGLHIPDSALFLHAMDMFPSGFHSAYATCQAAGDASIAYYSVPHLWLYGLLGLIARVLPLDSFLTYGIANGLGAAFYLWVVFRFLLVIVPRFAVTSGASRFRGILPSLRGLRPDGRPPLQSCVVFSSIVLYPFSRVLPRRNGRDY
jgi:hypothetical protein